MIMPPWAEALQARGLFADAARMGGWARLRMNYGSKPRLPKTFARAGPRIYVPIVMEIDGSGDWKAWSGNGRAMLVGSAFPDGPGHSGPGAPHLVVNLTIDRRFDHRFLYRLVFLALRCGGLLDDCDGETARFAFPMGSVAEFMGQIGCRAPVGKTSISPRSVGGSWVNLRFQDGEAEPATVTPRLR